MLGWRPVMLSWLNTLPKTLNDENKELIRDLFERMEEALLQFIRKGGVKVRPRLAGWLEGYFADWLDGYFVDWLVG